MEIGPDRVRRHPGAEQQQGGQHHEAAGKEKRKIASHT
jgi:hypothetical protein